MKIGTNLALYPAAARRRSASLLMLSVLFGLALTTAHLIWALPDSAPAATIRGDAELLSRETSVLRARLDDLNAALDPVVLRELSDRVGVANDFIVRGAVEPVTLLEALETTAPAGLIVERLSLASSEDGLRAEVSIRAGSQAQALALVEDLRRNESIRDITPVSEQIAEGADQLVLSLLFRPPSLDRR